MNEADRRGGAWRAVLGVVLAGAVVGVVLALLVGQGNPGNAGVCGACFLRDWAGALGLHGAGNCRYVRPEVAGVVLGALLAAAWRGEVRARGGGSPMGKLFLGAWVSVGALVFLGCPFRMLQRLGGGDLNAVVGLAGLVAGISLALVLTRRGCDQGRAAPLPLAAGLILPFGVAAVLVASLAGAPGVLVSDAPPGSVRAPWAASLGGALLVGALLQRTRFCTLGALRDALFYRDRHLLTIAAAIVVAYGVASALGGRFTLGLEGQPIAHTDAVWNFLAMLLTGLAASLAGGCPVRQMVLAGEGDTGAATALVGMALGAALAHSFALVSSGAGPTPAGKVAVVVGVVACLALALASRPNDRGGDGGGDA